MNRLYAFFEGKLIGVLTQDEENIYSFEYDQNWNGFDLSLAMPVSQKKFGNKITLSFFENLLPEGEVKKSIELHQKIKGTFEFLDHFGHDLAGAIIVTDDLTYIHSIDPKDNLKVEMAKIYNVIEEKGSVVEAISDMNPGYLSLAGAQDKFPAIYKEGHFYLPKKGGATTHIIKTPIVRSGVTDSVFNEFFCMSLAKKVGLNVPNIFILHGKSPLYVIERYDRVESDNLVLRIHQQDFCQALGLGSNQKYESKNGPSFKDCYDLLLNEISPSERFNSATQLLDWLCFNILIGNNDSHAKNISILFKEGKLILAPFYDLLSTEIYPKLSKDFSFFIGDRKEGNKIGKNQFNQLEEDLGIKQNALIDRMLNVQEKVLGHKKELMDSINEDFGNIKILKRIDDFILNRIKSLSKQGIK